MSARGLLLAAGAGRRMGMPKALVADGAGPWLPRAVATLLAGGCAGVTVVLGAAVEEALALLDGSGAGRSLHPDVEAVVAADWESGMSASLAAGLRALPATTDVALVHLVDLPDVGAEVVARVLAAAPDGGALARASYAGVPGHPVALGREHWDGVLATAAGDSGAKGYLDARPTRLVECGDLASGRDVDAR